MSEREKGAEGDENGVCAEKDERVEGVEWETKVERIELDEGDGDLEWAEGAEWVKGDGVSEFDA